MKLQKEAAFWIFMFLIALGLIIGIVKIGAVLAGVV